MRSKKLHGFVTFFHHETDEEYELEYEGCYEPARMMGHPDFWTPDESYIEVLNLPDELEEYREAITVLCWENEE